MRIRLTIERHGLAPVNTIWAIADSQSPLTTVDLWLQQVNEVFPLEADDWGLEDYTVEIGGFECVHYQLVAQIFKEDDHVKIRPLARVEFRQRTLSGRYQVSSGGLSLLDGVPFGKAGFKRVERPPIRIPARRQRKLLQGEDLSSASGTVPSQLESSAALAGDYGQEAEEDEEDIDEDFRWSTSDSEESVVSDKEVDDISLARSDSSVKRVRFLDDASPKATQFNALVVLPDDDEDEDEEGDDDYSPSVESSSEEDSDEEMSEDSQSNSLDKPSSQVGPGAISDTEKITSVKRQDPSAALVDEKLKNNSETNKKRKAENAAEQSRIKQQKRIESPSDRLRTTEDGPSSDRQPFGLPFQGKSKTAIRNARRRDHNKLVYLKSIGELPNDANRKDLEEWRERKMREGNAPQPETMANGTKERTPSTSDSSDTSSDSDSDSSSDSEPEVQSSRDANQVRKDFDAGNGFEDPVLEARRQQLLDALASGDGIDVTPNRLAKKRELDSPTSGDTNERDHGTQHPKPSLDAAAARRMVLGSLAMRDPTKPRKAVALSSNFRTKTPAARKPDTEEDADAWKSQINVTAVECLIPDIQLTEPPFPFKQNWDPQSRYLRGLNRHPNDGFGKSKKRKRKEYDDDCNDDYYDESGMNDTEMTYDENPTLNYDDANGDHSEPTADAAHEFPPLPKDMTTLPTLDEPSLVPGALIVFKQMLCNKQTNWSPTMSDYRTARVEEKQNDGTYLLTLAPHDRPKKDVHYDHHGKRVFEKFEMHGLDDDELETLEEGSTVELAFSEMTDGRLLCEAGALEAANGEGVEKIGKLSPEDMSIKAFNMGFTNGKAAAGAEVLA